MPVTFILYCVSVSFLLCRVILFTDIYVCLFISPSITNCNISVTYLLDACSYDVMFFVIEIKYCSFSSFTFYSALKYYILFINL